MEKPYAEFEELLASFYEDTFRLHHWVYKWQDAQRRKCRRNYQKGHIIIELDYAAKMKQFGQDAMPCSAAKQTSNFIVFVHFDPIQDDTGKNIDDTTEVFSFHSDCTKQDSQPIRRFLTHIIENMKARRKLNIGGIAHVWADGSSEQNKGRKAFRNLSELAALLQVIILVNFASTAHFAGPWDTEGGRHHRAITIHLQNDRGDKDCESVLCAKDNVRLIRRVMIKAGAPDPPVASQKMWRPAAATAAVSAPTPEYTSRPRSDKVKKQARGRTDEEMAALEEQDEGWYRITRRHVWRAEPCPCASTCKCPNDGRLTYTRDETYDSTPIKGTHSTYCYAFFKRALHVSVRQFSCYCRWCSRGNWDKCVNIDIVRHDVSRPVKPFDAGYNAWRDQGWRRIVLQVKSAPDPATTRVAVQSLDAAKAYVNKVAIGTTIAFLTADGDNRGYWLASKQSEMRKSAANDDTTGVKKGEYVLDIIWYDHMTGLKYMKTDYETVASVSSVLVTVSNIIWSRQTTNRYYLSETCHEKLTDIVTQMSEI
jgi:hypothetical protein